MAEEGIASRMDKGRRRSDGCLVSSRGLKVRAMRSPRFAARDFSQS